MTAFLGNKAVAQEFGEIKSVFCGGGGLSLLFVGLTPKQNHRNKQKRQVIVGACDTR